MTAMKGIPASAEIDAVLLDIEGTTTPIEFVHTTLFRYAADHVTDFIRNNAAKEEIRGIIMDLFRSWRNDSGNGLEPPQWGGDPSDFAGAASYCKWLISRDSKATPLKALQGHIWEEGFRSGALKGEVYSDVPAAVKRWKGQGKAVCIYSSGSARAQELIFGTLEQGNLAELLDGFFDTSVGHKRDEASYRNIAARLGVSPGKILFLSDVEEELDAASRAGINAVLVARDGVQVSSQYAVVRTFDGLLAD